MNEFAKRWVSALRSGAYQQGKGALCANGKYCCLGVACEIYRIAYGIDVGSDTRGRRTYYGEAMRLPNTVRNVLGLATRTGRYSYDMSLASVNDRGGSFNQIANLIESQPAGLFKNS